MTGFGGSSQPSGGLGLTLIRHAGQRQVVHAEPRWPTTVPTMGDIRRNGLPRAGLPHEVNAWRAANSRNLWRGAGRILPARVMGLPHMYGQLWLSVFRGNGEILDLGLASLRVVTTAGCRFVCDDFNAGASSADVSNMKFHGFGTGTNAEAVGDTALQTELTTQYATDNTRPTGSQASATSGNNGTYTTVGTLSPDSGGTIAITEHGILSQAATGGGTLLDRSVFSAVNLVAGSDSLQATYVFTQVAGS